MPYTPPNISSAGLSIPAYNDILAYLVSQFLGIYGSASYLGTDTADYQDIAIRGLQALEVNQAIQAVYLAGNPVTAIGASLDLLGKLIGTARKSASYSSAVLTVTGTPGTVITNGVAVDVNGIFWNLASPATIGSGGTTPVLASAQQLGTITANPGDISRIGTPTAGWTAVTNLAAAIPGAPIEPDSQYRARLLLSQAKPSLTRLAGTLAAIEAVDGVTRAAVYENPTNVDDANGLPPHSITCVTEGGLPADVASAIYANRGIGCATNGSTVVSVSDPLNPAITMAIRFDPLGYVPIFVRIVVHPLVGFTTATESSIHAAIVDYLNSLGIGQSVVFSELYGAALSARPDPDQPMFSIYEVKSGPLAAETSADTVNGSADITVTSATGIVVGQYVTGAGVSGTVAAISGTTVTLSTTAGSTASAVPVQFFTVGTADIAVAFNEAAHGQPINVLVVLA